MVFQLRRMKLIFSKLLIVLAALIFPAAAVTNTSVKTVYLYTYHNKPPFIVDLKKRTGLFFDLAQYLSQQDSQIQYRTEYIPRKRLDRLIETESLDAVVIGVNPVWFNDISKKRFLWLPPIYKDRDDFVSLSSTPFDFEGPKSFVDKRVVGVAGYYYFGINEAVEKGVLQRVDTIGEKEVLDMLARERADFGIVSRSVFTYLKSQSQLPDIYHLSAQPHDIFLRSAFTLKKHKEIHQRLLPLMESLRYDKQWKLIAAQYV